MTAAMKHLLVLTVLLAAIHGGVRAEEPNETAVEPVFEISATALEPISPQTFMRFVRSPRPKGFFHKPAYAAAVVVDGPGLFVDVPPESMRSFLGFAQEQGGLSEQQKSFLEATRGLLDSNNILVHRRLADDPKSPVRLLLYAMTLEDARRMARAYVEFTMRAFEGRTESLEEVIAAKQEKVARAEKRLHELDATAQTAEGSLAEVQKTVGYRSRQEAMEAIAELDRMRNAAQVEIAGIEARIAAIQGYQQQERGGTPAVVSKLGMMFIEEAVALRGAEARRKMATQLREEANKFVDARQTIESVGAQKEQLLAQMTADRSAIADVQRGLQSERQQRPQVADSPIVIYPVEWTVEEVIIK